MKKRTITALIMGMVLLLAGCGGKTAGSGAQAETGSGLNAPAGYPEKAVELIIPYAEGGAMDNNGRIFAKYVEKFTGNAINVTNVPGSSGAKGADQLVKAPADGYTVMLSEPGPGFVRTGANQVPFDFESALVPAARLTADSRLIAVNTEYSAFKTPEEFITYTKDHPGELRIGTPGEYTDGGMSVELLSRSGLDVSPVPCDGSAGVRKQLLDGEIDAGALTVFDVYPLLSDNKILVVGVLSEERLEALPDTPTFRELGYDAVWNTYRGLNFRAGTDSSILDYWTELAGTISEDPDYQSELAAHGLKPAFLNSEEYASTVHNAFETIRDIMK